MLRTVGLRANASRLVFFSICVLALGSISLALPVPEADDIAQQIITYGYLVSAYPDEFLVGSGPTTGLGRDMKALKAALDALTCDVSTRLAFPHKAIIVPSSLMEQWIGFSLAEPPSLDGGLFVLQPLGGSPSQVLVVLSTKGPARSTAFWREGAGAKYSTKLLYDSFKNSTPTNQAPMMGATVAVRLGENRKLLLRESIEPGAGQRELSAVGRVFEVDLSSAKITLVAPGALPQR